MRSVLTLSILLLASATARAEIPVERPTFCEGYQPLAADNNWRWIDGKLQNFGVGNDAMVLMAKAACDKPDDPERQKMLAKWRELIVADYGVSADFTVKMLRVRLLDDQWKKLNQETNAFCQSMQEGARESKRLEAEAAAVGHLLSCPNATKPVVDWFVDETINTSEIMRAGLVGACWFRVDRGRLTSI